MKKIIGTIEKMTDYICLFLMSVAFLITFFHIIGRYILKTPIFFSEELARYCFVWTCMLGAAIVNRKDEHTSVTYFVGLLPKKFQGVLYILREILIIVLLVALIYHGIVLSIKMRTVRTAAMGLSWALIYISLPVGSMLMILSTIKLILAKFREITQPERR
ncbi:MAG TPA: TRAP transporter small permease [Spirochaetales bacterium]|nr:TRAP transporter small permease [Spirochaetales bacterium]